MLKNKLERQLFKMLKLKLYGIYMIRCDVIDDNSIALMIDASNTFGDILPILYDFATIFTYFLLVNVITSSQD